MGKIKKPREEVVRLFMEDFKKEFDNKVKEHGYVVPASLREWIFIHQALKLERLLEIIVRKNNIALEKAVVGDLQI